MMIVKDSEWVLSEVGDKYFMFENRRDNTVRLTVQKCRYIIKSMDYALNFVFEGRVPSCEPTINTYNRLSPQERMKLKSYCDRIIHSHIK